MAKLSNYSDVLIHQRAREAICHGASEEWLTWKAENCRTEAFKLSAMKAPSIVVEAYHFLHDIFDQAARMLRIP